jgi:hypothetical protein
VRISRILALLLVLLSCNLMAAAKDLALISNKSNRVQELSLPDLQRIGRGQTDHWPDGKSVIFVIRDPGLPGMKSVLDKIYGMSIQEVKGTIASANHGRTEHPAVLVVDTDEAILKKVESTPGAVGLVDVYSITGSVTVLKLEGKLPLEPGYLLHGN